MTALEHGVDRWPTFELSPVEYEQAVAGLVQSAGHEIADWQVQHLDPVEGLDGTYIIDVTARFRLMGADFLMLFECKRHASPVKREHVQVLKDKLQSTGAQKGVVVAASGFQRGALEYARRHGIACVRLVDGAWVYETRDIFTASPQATGGYVAYARQITDHGYRNTLLTDQQQYARELLFEVRGEEPTSQG
ncbi:restriction endonuclease [Streptomyces sp. NPDC005279]|uniref:restriction endonuclease n=1 Tax=Streptomyces sp. NPDC005279 TaxID=3364712 RepID=UPI003693E878